MLLEKFDFLDLKLSQLGHLLTLNSFSKINYFHLLSRNYKNNSAKDLAFLPVTKEIFIQTLNKTI